MVDWVIALSGYFSLFIADASYRLVMRSSYIKIIKISINCLSDDLAIPMFHQQSHKGNDSSQVHIWYLTKYRIYINSHLKVHNLLQLVTISTMYSF